MMYEHTPQIPVATQENSNILKISNDFFEVRHDKNAGGTPVSILFKNGSGSNFLEKPVSAHAALKKDGQVVFYRQCNGKADAFSFETRENGVEIHTEGLLTDEKGNTIPVRYQQTFFYQAWGRVNVTLQLRIEEQLNDVYEIGTCGFYVPERVDTLGVRPSCPPPPPAGYLMSAESNLKWFDLTRRRSYTQQECAAYNLIPSYFALFEKGVEGLEFWREDCGKSWDSPFGNHIGGGIFIDDTKRLAPGLKYIRVEPVNSWSYPKSFQPGTETFRYTIGLPFIRKTDDARKAIFHIAITSRIWPDRAAMKKLADAGIKLIRLHDDNTFLQPSWRDCCYPPYDEANMKKMDEVIARAHEFGIKIVPYFSLKEFHPDCPEYPEKSHQWKRWVHSDGRIIAEEGPYGGYMCMKSGWLEFLKSTIKRVLDRHDFDGVYYDHLWFRYCRHPEHADGLWHNDADEILDFLFWSRECVGKDGVIFLHTSACPTIIGENLSDLMFIGEDMPYARPLPDTYPPDMEFVPVIPRNWVPAGAHWDSEFRESMMLSCLKHCPGGPMGLNDFMLETASVFKRYALNDLPFQTRLAFPQTETEKTVYVNVYSDQKRLVFLCANLAKEAQTIRLNVSDFAAAANDLQVENAKITANAQDHSWVEAELQPENIGMIEFAI